LNSIARPNLASLTLPLNTLESISVEVSKVALLEIYDLRAKLIFP